MPHPSDGYMRFTLALALLIFCAVLLALPAAEQQQHGDESEVGDFSRRWVSRIPRKHPQKRPRATISLSQGNESAVVYLDKTRPATVYTLDAMGGEELEELCYTLPHRPWTVDGHSIHCGHARLCVLSNTTKGILFYELPKSQAGRIESVSNLELGNEVGGFHSAIFSPKHNVIFATAVGTNHICVVSIENWNDPTIVQVLGATESGPPKTRYEQVNGLRPHRLAISLDGRDLYVSNRGPIRLLHFRVSENDGSLKLATSYGYNTLPLNRKLIGPVCRSIGSIAVNPNGSKVYTASSGVSVFSRDPKTGALTWSDSIFPGSDDPRMPVERGITSVRCSADGELVAIAQYQSGTVKVFDHDKEGRLRAQEILRNGPDEKFLTNVSDAVFVGDGRSLAITSADLIIGVIKLDSPEE